MAAGTMRTHRIRCYTVSMQPFPYGKLTLYALCGMYCVYVITHLSTWHVIDGMNLLIHEAGHAIFSPFGTFLHILGGSLLQIAIPCLFAWYFYAKMQYIESAVMLLWIGQNLIHVSVYIGDAVAMELPLLGGDTTMHDWNNLLSMMHALPSTGAISHTVYGIGILTLIASIILIGWKEIYPRI